MTAPVVTLLGGPTTLIEAGGFTALGIGPRLKLLQRGVPTTIDPR